MYDRLRSACLGSVWLLVVVACVVQPGPVVANTQAGLSAAVPQSGLVAASRDPLVHFYAERQGRPLWFDGPLPSPRIDELLAVLRDAGSEGLDPADYRPEALREACYRGPPLDPLGCELSLTDSLLRYARDVSSGVLTASAVDPDWHIPQQPLPVAQLLTRVANADALTPLLRALPPPHAAYHRLREALARYRQAGPTPWPLVANGPLLRVGDRGRRVCMLRARLGAELPTLLDVDDACLFDAGLHSAVVDFQTRQGLAADGVVGPQTLLALNVPLSVRIAELRLNMERWRWLPRELGSRYILVNLAGFELTLVRDGQPALGMRVIAGRPDRSTPAIQSAVSQLVLNPEWTVPRRIAVEDLLPQLQRDPLALQAKGIRVLARQGSAWIEVDPRKVDWSRHHVNDFPYVLRQAAGPENSLGRIKLNMFNPFDIYLHDTPARGLFRNPQRAFSSGCIRVEKPLPLAAHLFDGDTDQIGAWLWRRIDRGDTDRVAVSPSVPVYLVYLTAWVDDDGTVQLRPDIYRRNSQLSHRFMTETGA